jgi:hypothetical protein
LFSLFRKVTMIVTLTAAAYSFAGIGISTPAPGTGVSSPTHFVYTASSDTGTPISSMILMVDNVEKYRTYSAKIDTYQSLSLGWHQVMVKAWDGTGRYYQAGNYGVNVTSGGSASTAPTSQTASGSATFSNIEQMSGWGHCDTCAGAGGSGPSAPYSLTQGVTSPSLDGKSAKFWIGGSTPYTDVLWWKQLVPESKASYNSSIHHFVYDLYYYTDNAAAAQSIEWDVNQFVNGRSYIFGSQCSYRSAGTWDVWDNVHSHWISTGIKCPALQSRTWQHVVLEFERTTDNRLRYISITLNGTKHYLNWYYASTATSWSGITVNYQMDGNYQQADYNTWVDKMNLSAW